ncbi:MAG: LysR family transcriptional regulator [Chloroflexi bacterium]|nr:LysR family transcriptional regulator [Chloroflexota bacterium]
MEIRELRSFCTAARLKSITKAAELLQLGQPTVTTHIKKLEEELGTPLFDRVTRPIQLTPAGVALAGVATPLVEGIDGLAATATADEEDGPVSLASTHDIISHALLRVVSIFLKLYPRAHLRVRSALTGEVMDMVAQRQVDMGLVPAMGSSEDFDFTPLFASERVLITPKGHPLLEKPLVSLDEIAQWPLILRKRETDTSRVLEAEFQRKGLSYDVRVELDSMDMVKRYVALGMGVSVGPRLAIEPKDLDDLGIVSLSSLLPVEQAGVVTLRGRTLSTPTRSFISVLKDTFSEVASTA